jgi:hypothetical protein
LAGAPLPGQAERRFAAIVVKINYPTTTADFNAHPLDLSVSGVLRLLALAVLVAVLSRLAKAMQEYITRLVVQKLGTSILIRASSPSRCATSS